MDAEVEKLARQVIGWNCITTGVVVFTLLILMPNIAILGIPGLLNSLIASAVLTMCGIIIFEYREEGIVSCAAMLSISLMLSLELVGSFFWGQVPAWLAILSVVGACGMPVVVFFNNRHLLTDRGEVVAFFVGALPAVGVVAMLVVKFLESRKPTVSCGYDRMSN